MVVVIDANILISACLKINDRLANLIFSTASKTSFVIPEYVLLEIKENEAKILRSAKTTMPNLTRTFFTSSTTSHYKR